MLPPIPPMPAPGVAPVPIPIAGDDATEPGPVAPARKRSRRDAAESVEPAPVAELLPEPSPVAANDDEAEEPELFAHEPPAPLGVVDAPRGPAIVEPRQPPKPMPTNKPVGDWQMKDGRSGFHLPAVDEILEGETVSTRIIDRLALTATAAKLVQKLNDLGVQGEVTEIRPGPVVTMYEFKPAAGIKLSRIASLGDDLAMAMEALRVRIVAPIPGKGVVGFEVPNRTRETVFLKEVVEQEAFQKGGSRLTMAIGKDIEGLPYVSDLAKMPHLLIDGTTGSGKSVGVNAMLVSMLMRATPEELRFIMVDPKMLELSIYDGIPHLLLPVVTDPKKAAMALRWGVEEMERRYELLAGAGVRNIGQYNKHVEKKNEELASRPIDLPVFNEEGEPVLVSSSEPELLKKLPYIVIVIDELADLMMVAAKEVEVYIARLAQMARAAGIHLMVATQRPSTDVLTGVIKANFPSRISFQVASRHDSGTIINTPGAENLLGMGDMLILPPGTSSLTRVHGAYVSETEINRLTGFWKGQGAPVYDPEILRPREEEGGDSGGEDEVADELYDQALHAVSDMKVVSISLLQRKMRIGYNRAARMIERMERDGVVGPADGMKPREVLIHGIGREPNL
jgi:S-DNA-T family DNA segregation ATPase FtsK/SpoIIIE